MKTVLCALLLNGLLATGPIALVAGGNEEPGPNDRECRYYFGENLMVCTTKTGGKHHWAYSVPGADAFERRKNFNRWVLMNRSCWGMKQNVNPQRDQNVLFEPATCTGTQLNELGN